MYCRPGLLAIYVLMSASVLPLAGCGNRLFANRNTNPSLKDYISTRTGTALYGILSTTAGRRVVLIDLKTEHFCSEPPPDAAENVSSSVAAALSASIPTQFCTPEGAATFAHSF